MTHSLCKYSLFLPLLGVLVACGPALPDQQTVGGRSVTALSADDPAPVRLVYAVVRNYGCASCLITEGYIEVANLAPTKQVSVVVSVDGGAFEDVPGSFIGTIDSNREIWTFRTHGLGRIELAVRYQANGNVYWDNNGGSNYYVRSENVTGRGFVMSEAALGDWHDVALTAAVVPTLDAGQFNVSMLVRNRAFAKDVRAVYSIDNWRTIQVAAAHFTQMLGAVEQWDVSAPFQASATALDLAVAESQDGDEQWDSQYGKNFHCFRCQNRLCQWWLCQGLTLSPAAGTGGS